MDRGAAGRHPYLIAFGLSFGVMIALGLARFAYALVLPAMRADLGWTYAQAGTVNAGNAVGYLVGALVAAPLMRLNTRLTFAFGAVLTALALLVTGASSGFAWLLALRFLSGVTGALAFIAGGALASHVAAGAGRSAVLVGLTFAGGGLGILASGVALPGLLESGWRWPSAWALMGAVAFAASVPAVLAARLAPEPPRAVSTARLADARVLVPDAVAYFLFAVGYIAYMTFAVAFLRETGRGTLEVSAFWAVLGVSSAATPFVWGGFVGRARGGRALSVLLGVLTLAALLPLASTATPVMLASAALFGAFLAVPGCVTAIARRHLEPASWGTAIALLTVVFAAGQIVGPVGAGVLADGLGGLASSLVWSAAMTALGAFVALWQRA